MKITVYITNYNYGRFIEQAIDSVLNQTEQDFEIIISFSDTKMNHHGYIYQACNFLYTGTTANSKKLVDKEGNEFHFRNLAHVLDRLKGKKDIKHRKRRINEENLDRVLIANFLRKNKGQFTANQLDKIFGYKDTAAHWFRLDKGFSFPTVDDWIRLKQVLNFDDSLDNLMINFEWYPDRQDVIRQLNLEASDERPKHRYLFIKGKNKNK